MLFLKTFEMISIPALGFNSDSFQTENNSNQVSQNAFLPIIISYPYFSTNDAFFYTPCLATICMSSPNKNYSMNLPDKSNQVSILNITQNDEDKLLNKMSKIISDPTNNNLFYSQLKNLKSTDKTNDDANSSGKKQPNTDKKINRVHFTKEEDDKIKELVNIFGTKNWTTIASFIKGRTAKQCRDRYSNYLTPGFFNGEWTKEEDELLIKLYNENGSKWSIIQNYLPKRSSNSIKNRWHYFLRQKSEKKEETLNEKILDKKNLSENKIVNKDCNEKSLENNEFNEEVNANDAIDEIFKENENIFNLQNNIDIFDNDYVGFI